MAADHSTVPGSPGGPASIERVERVASLADVAADGDRLVARMPTRHPQYAYSWQEAWWSEVGRYSGELLCLGCWAVGARAPVALAPLTYRVRRSRALVPVREIRRMTDGGGDQNDILGGCDAGAAIDDWPAYLSATSKKSVRRDLLPIERWLRESGRLEVVRDDAPDVPGLLAEIAPIHAARQAELKRGSRFVDADRLHHRAVRGPSLVGVEHGV